MLESPIVKSIAEKAQKTPAQVHLGSPVLRCFSRLVKLAKTHIFLTAGAFLWGQGWPQEETFFLFQRQCECTHTVIFLVKIL